MVKGRSSKELSRAKEAEAGKTYTPKEQQLLAVMLQASSEGKLIGAAGKFVARPVQGSNGSDELTGQPQEKPYWLLMETTRHQILRLFMGKYLKANRKPNTLQQ